LSPDLYPLPEYSTGRLTEATKILRGGPQPEAGETLARLKSHSRQEGQGEGKETEGREGKEQPKEEGEQQRRRWQQQQQALLEEHFTKTGRELERIRGLLGRYQVATQKAGLPTFKELLLREEGNVKALLGASLLVKRAALALTLNLNLTPAPPPLISLQRGLQEASLSAEKKVHVALLGPARAGKSSLIGSIVGEELSPIRKEEAPLTVVPVRYLHDPRAKIPAMLVPFSQRLNSALKLLKGWIRQHGGFALKNGLLERDSLKAFVDRVEGGGVGFQSTYEGAFEIWKALLDIHDLFRLAAEPRFHEDLAKELNVEWMMREDLDLSSSPPSLITVHVNFPNYGPLTGLIRPSLIDFPAFDDPAVVGLGLKNFLLDLLSSCHVAVVASKIPSWSSKDELNWLKESTLIPAMERNIPMVFAGTFLDTCRKEVAFPIFSLFLHLIRQFSHSFAFSKKKKKKKRISMG